MPHTGRAFGPRLELGAAIHLVPPEAPQSWPQLLSHSFPALLKEGWQIRSEGEANVLYAKEEQWYTEFHEGGRKGKTFENSDLYNADG